MFHNIDLHAVAGPGGGAGTTMAAPGETKSFKFKAMYPGLFVYHCATPMVANHISNGMYGMILVEPAGGLPKVDREFYVMQGELYTAEPFGTKGLQEFSVDKLVGEQPEYFVFNGAAGALTDAHPLHAKQGETVRIFFGVGGPNSTSSFHVIGTVFDRVFSGASLTSPPLTNVQTITVAPGGATVVDLSLPVPGKFMLVDHALSRMEHGLIGALVVEGKPAPELFSGLEPEMAKGMKH
jgi:nitrite reductase (NO-forming)